MFQPEGDAWYGIKEFNLLEKNITIPGFSPLYPDAHCTSDGDICQLITGESEINAASTISALVFSSRFDLKHTYFMVAGIAGVNPEVATLGSVTFARYTVQVALQYEFDAREIPYVLRPTHSNSLSMTSPCCQAFPFGLTSSTAPTSPQDTFLKEPMLPISTRNPSTEQRSSRSTTTFARLPLASPRPRPSSTRPTLWHIERTMPKPR
jgi:hypothetical protein